MISLNINHAFGEITQSQIEAYEPLVKKAMEMLHQGTGKGSDFLGWLKLPAKVVEYEINEIIDTADRFKSCETVVVIGIGGSYLGTKAVVEALTPNFDLLQKVRNCPKLLFAGHHLSEDYLAELCEHLTGKKFGVINISKSGTTTEPAIAFRVLNKLLKKNIGSKEAKEFIVAITDKSSGALRALAEKEGYKTFAIPDNVGGRFSVFTPCGLLPIAIAGIDIVEMMSGVLTIGYMIDRHLPFTHNIASRYAATRHALYTAGKKIEILANYHPKLHYVGEWWKQLYGESEGKEGKGIFPASVDFTTDLHSLGQWIQEGERTIFETVISIKEPSKLLKVPREKDDLDGLNYLAGKRIDFINKMAEQGTRIAHVEGGVPNIQITLPKLNPFYIGQLLFFFEKACALSGYLLDVNPFDQPGVEAYKKKMFALLNKPSS